MCASGDTDSSSIDSRINRDSDPKHYRFLRQNADKLSSLVHKDNANDVLAMMEKAWTDEVAALRADNAMLREGAEEWRLAKLDADHLLHQVRDHWPEDVAPRLFETIDAYLAGGPTRGE